MTDSFVILMVDDTPNNLFTLRALLKRLHDCEVVEARSGHEALMRVVERPVHLILLDVQMPGMDGFETARHLQMTERTRHIPIIFITAVFKASEFSQRGYEIGAVDYLTKPIDDHLLINRVRLYQGLFRRERQLTAMVERLRHSEQTLAAAREAAEAANRAKSIFLANMSHEFRTPLNAILGFAQILEHDTRIPADERRHIATIHRSGHHLLTLINDVLEISRIEAGRVQIQTESFDLPAVLTAVTDMILVRTEAKGLAFTTESPSHLPHYVVGDAHHLSQVLINLLGNAVKYTDQGRICLTLTLLPGQHIGFAVTDTGPGIAQEDQGRVFQAFYQTGSGMAKGDGTGLGLTISREFVRLMGGDLTVESQWGAGSRFAFALPLPVSSGSTATPLIRQVVGLAPGQPGYRVLIVEDEPVNRELLLIILEDIGLEVREAKNGQEAVALFQSWAPHLIWMDIRMPEMDGLAATRAIRALPGGRSARIIALTASAFQEDRASILAAGCDEVATKPFEAAHIFQIMAGQLGLRYCYAETAPTESGILPGNLDVPLPAKLRDELRAAAELLDLEAAHTLVESLRAEHPEAARRITAWLNNYRFDRLIEWCQRS
ncbi:MAG: response regulator [Pseudomonadota bacterium]